MYSQIYFLTSYLNHPGSEESHFIGAVGSGQICCLFTGTKTVSCPQAADRPPAWSGLHIQDLGGDRHHGTTGDQRVPGLGDGPTR